MPESNCPASSTSSHSGTIWVLGIAGTFILYLLSPGVFAVFYHLGTTPPPWLNYVLIPIAWACQEFPFVNHLYELYLNFLGAPI